MLLRIKLIKSTLLLIPLTFLSCSLLNTKTTNRPGDQFCADDMVISNTHYIIDKDMAILDKLSRESIPLASIEDMAAQKDSGNLYLLVPDSKIFKIDHSGILLQQLDAFGQGPGEISLPTTIRYKNNQLYVLDEGNHKISIFSNVLKWRADLKLNDSPILTFDIDDDGNIVIPNIDQQNNANESLFKIYSPEGKLLRECSSNKYIDDDFSNALPRPLVYVTPDNCMIVAFRIHGTIYKFSMNGDLLFKSDINGGEEWRESVKAEIALRKELKRKSYHWRLNYLYVTSKGSIFAAWGGVFKSRKTLSMIYDTQGTFIGRLYQSDAFPYTPKKITFKNDSTLILYSESDCKLAECTIRKIK